jgi:hypothetical protein
LTKIDKMTINLNLTRHRHTSAQDDNELLIDTIETIFSFTNYNKAWIEDVNDLGDIRIYTDSINEYYEQVTHHFTIESLWFTFNFCFSEENDFDIRGDCGGGKVPDSQHVRLYEYMIESDNRFVYDVVEGEIKDGYLRADKNDKPFIRHRVKDEFFDEKNFDQKELNKCQEETIYPSTEYQSMSIPDIWRKIINQLEPLTTRELLMQQGTLIEFDGVIARISFRSESLLKLVQGKLTNLQAAFRATFQRQILVVLEVSDTNPDKKNRLPPPF